MDLGVRAQLSGMRGSSDKDPITVTGQVETRADAGHLIDALDVEGVIDTQDSQPPSAHGAGWRLSVTDCPGHYRER